MDLSRALIGAAALHTLALGLVARAPWSTGTPPASSSAIAVTLAPRGDAAVEPPSPRASHAPQETSPPRRHRRLHPARSLDPSVALRARPAGTADAPPDAPSATPAPVAPSSAPRALDLFPGRVLSAIADANPPLRVERDQGSDGVVRSDGRGARPERSAAEVIDEVTGRAVGEQNVRSGRVPPAWHDLERDLVGRFHPTVDDITSKRRGALAASQLGRVAREGVTSEPLRRAEMDTATRYDGSSRELGNGLNAMQQQFAAAAAANQPGEWQHAEVRVVLTAGGRVREITLVTSSGRAALDRQAVAAVRLSLHRWLPELAATAPCEAIFALEAAVSVNLPSATLGLSFDESLHVLRPHVPLARETSLRTRLQSFRPLHP